MFAILDPMAAYDLGGTRVLYVRCPRTSVVELCCLPLSAAAKVAKQREFHTGPHVDHLPQHWRPVPAHAPEWLTPVKTSGSPYVHGFTQSLSMRFNKDVETLRLEGHRATEIADGGCLIETTVAGAGGLLLTHRLRWEAGAPFFRVSVEARNVSCTPVTVEYLPSFSLGGITPLDAGSGVERLRLHRFRSFWSAEGRHEARLLEELGLEQAWAGYGMRAERWGQCGSMPVRGWFPWGALEDTEAGVFWGAQLAVPGSWHLEVSRLKDKVNFSGGLPCRDFGEWWVALQPGEIFAAPEAALACVEGGLDDLCHALTEAQRAAAAQQPTANGPLPVVFNEWCTTWGSPTHQSVTSAVEKLSRHGLADVFVIDDGWAQRPPDQHMQHNGDWVVDTEKFPGGLGATVEAIRSEGMRAGIWFEMECVTEGTEAFGRTELHLHRDGKPVQVGSRHFWDLRNPQAEEYLAQKVIGRLRKDEFGYLKIDYNDCLPPGVDGPSASPGENLRLHLLAVQRFIERIRREVPGVMIESCSSGGHRLEPSFVGLTAMSSFSDAHEAVEIPIIAANLHRLMLAHQVQIWCVVHGSDDLQRLRYGLSAGFLGVLALSGEVGSWQPWQVQEIASARVLHHKASEVIRSGRTRIYREMSASWHEPRGWQAVVRATEAEALVVLHGFGALSWECVQVPLPPGRWSVEARFGDAGAVASQRCEGSLAWQPPGEFCGGVCFLRRK